MSYHLATSKVSFGYLEPRVPAHGGNGGPRINGMNKETAEISQREVLCKKRISRTRIFNLFPCSTHTEKHLHRQSGLVPSRASCGNFSAKRAALLFVLCIIRVPMRTWPWNILECTRNGQSMRSVILASYLRNLALTFLIPMLSLHIDSAYLAACSLGTYANSAEKIRRFEM